MDYEDGQPIPPGYEVRTNINKELIGAGAGTLGLTWIVTAVLGAALQASAEFNAELTCSIVGALGAKISCEPEDDYRPMYIPVAGPFITMGTAHPNAGGAVALAASGVAQVGGLTVLIIGLATPSTKLIRKSAGVPAITVAPAIGQGSFGVSLVLSGDPGML